MKLPGNLLADCADFSFIYSGFICWATVRAFNGTTAQFTVFSVKRNIKPNPTPIYGDMLSDIKDSITTAYSKNEGGFKENIHSAIRRQCTDKFTHSQTPA